MRFRFRILVLALVWVCAAAPLTAQRKAAGNASLLQSGPMVGYSEFREVMLWAQTTAPAEVYVEYWDTAQPKQRYRTQPVRTEAASAYTAHLLADQVLPGRQYEYAVYVNGKVVARPYPLRFQSQVQWQYRTNPPKFRVAFGSCFYVNDSLYDRPGRAYGDSLPERILGSLVAQQPDAMIWLGDNTYTREVDWTTRTGIQYRYTHTRSLPALQPLLGNVHHYATWDDHDYGPNDSDESYVLKTTARNVFQQFWANRSCGLPATEAGVTTHFEWGDAALFLLDDRWFRRANYRTTAEGRILGEAQLEWLVNALKSSRATFKIVCIGGQVLNTAAVFETMQNIAPEERTRLLRLITEERIPGVLFVSGDRHHTEVSRLAQPGFYPIYEFTTSPLTAGPAGERARSEPNALRVDGSFFGEHNFLILEFSGPRTDRTLSALLFDKFGKQVWRYDIAAKSLQVPKPGGSAD